MPSGGRLSTRLYAFLRKADLERDIDRLLKAIEDELDSSSGAAPGFSYNCDSSVQVRDLVYIQSANLVNRASGSSISMSPAIGMVVSKPSSTTALVLYNGEVSGFSGLVTAQTYYMASAPGQITLTPPSDPDSVIQRIGVARSPTTLVVRIALDFTTI